MKCNEGWQGVGWIDGETQTEKKKRQQRKKNDKRKENGILLLLLLSARVTDE